MPRMRQLGDLFSRILPSTVLESDARGVFSRRRLFSKANTFWAFFSQVIDADGGCQEVVRKIQAFAAARSMPTPLASTSAYCQARAKLEQDCWSRSSPILRRAYNNVATAGHTKAWLWLSTGTCMCLLLSTNRCFAELSHWEQEAAGTTAATPADGNL